MGIFCRYIISSIYCQSDANTTDSINMNGGEQWLYCWIVRLGVDGSLVRDLPEALCCVLEPDTLSSA